MEPISPLALNFIKKFEGYTPKPKFDYKQHSVGYGTRWQPGTPIGTKADHEAALAREASKVSNWLGQNVAVPLDENKRAALTSFGFNLGVGNLNRLKPDIDAGNWDRVGQRMLSFNKAGGEVLPGLVSRREQEAAMLLGRTPSQTPIGAAPAGAAPQGGPIPMQPLTPPTDRRSRLADILLAQAAQARPTGWGSALNSLGDLVLGNSLSTKADKAQGEYSSKLAQMLGGASSPDQMTQALMSSGDPQLRNMGIQQKMQAMTPPKPLRGKERFMSTPGGVMDVETMQIVPGTEQDAGDKPIKVGNALVQKGPDGIYAPVYEAPADPGGGLKPPSGYRYGQDGSLEFIPGGPADPAMKVSDLKFSEGATKAANFANMMQSAEGALSALYKNPDGTPGQITENPIGWLGKISESLPEGAANLTRSPEYQQYRQAAMQWVRAKLRKESGAAISNPEFEGEFNTYFPQYGDSPEVIAQKNAARAEAQRGMEAESRGAYEQLFGGSAAPQPAPAPQQQAAPPAEAAPTAAPQPGQMVRPRARNPQTGEEIEFNEQSGQWEPVR